MSTNERPRVLGQLGLELDRAARRSLAGAGSRGIAPARGSGGSGGADGARFGERIRLASGIRLAPRRLSLVAVLAGLLVLAAAAAAAVVIISQGAPLAAPHAQDLQSSGVPLAASTRLAGLDAPDPEAGAPPWDIRLSRTGAGETCTAVGQVLNGQFGIVGLDHVFRVQPLGGVDACGVDSPDGPVLAGARVFVGANAQGARTVVNGVAGAGARSVTAYGPEGPRALRLGPDGSFVTVYRGYVEDVRPRIVVVDGDGKSHTIAFAQSMVFEVADPGGGSPWQVSGEAKLDPGASYPDESCAQVSQTLDQAEPSLSEAALTPSVCGRLGVNPLFVLMRRFVPGTGAGSGYPWNNNPARTLVYGAAAPRVAALTLSGAGAPRGLPIDPHGGVFLAVLDGHVDPRSLTLTARLRDGSILTYRHSTNLLDARFNRRVAEPPVPAYRNPLAPSREAFPPIDIPVRSSVRETLRVADPTGGPAWVLRSWRGLPNPKARFGSGYNPKSFLCFQVGIVRDGKLVEPHPGSPAHPGSTSQSLPVEEERCNAPSDLTRQGPLFDAQTYLADPYAYAPQPLRVVVSGQLPPGASHPVLLGAGAPRPLPVDANDAFLAVLPGRWWDASLHVAETIAGRTVGAGASSATSAPPVLAVPQARAPDPDGGAPWGFAVAPDGANAFGRIVQGRLADVEEATGTLSNGPNGWSSGSGGGNVSLRGNAQVSFDVQEGGASTLPGAGGEMSLSPPQIERRTLPGRTIITGMARADVVSVTLATPRDVRTLHPSGPAHALIAVYDGQFFRGSGTATIRLRDGQTVTESLPPGPAGVISWRPPRLTPALLLRGAKLEFAAIRANRSLSPARRKRAIARATAGLQARLRTIERRIAYEQAHPGLLPAP
jgi:hypothetical protein